MTERKKLSLSKPAQADSPSGADEFRKPPVRGNAPRKRMTASEAAQAREEANARAAQRAQAAEAPRGRDERSDRPYNPDRAPRGDRADRGDRPYGDAPRGSRGPGGPGGSGRPSGPFGAPGGRRDATPDGRRGGRDEGRSGGGRSDRYAEGPRGPQGAPGRSDGPRRDPRQDDRRPTDTRQADPRRGEWADRAPRDDRPYRDERSDRFGNAPRREDERYPSRPAAPRRDDRRATGYDNRPLRDDGRHAPQRHAVMPTQPPEGVDHDGRVRLSKLMSERGLSSRREADEWIEHGWVRVNGVVVSELGSRVAPDVEVTIDPMARTQQAERVTILLHKPIGYVSGQAEDGYEPAVVLITPENRWADDRMPIKLTRGHLKHLAPCGRLDIDSTGMLVLSQDGRIAKHLIGEDSGVEKEYLVRVEYMPAPGAENVSEVVPPEAIERLRFGLELDGRQLRHAQVSWQNEQQLRFVLREGRKRQIRRMCEQVGLKVVGLKRVRMGSVTLGKLPLGQWRFLRPNERF